ncbi:MAG: hypothetical protein U1E76_04915 [Planctomycetota bacterium]
MTIMIPIPDPPRAVAVPLPEPTAAPLLVNCISALALISLLIAILIKHAP